MHYSTAEVNTLTFSAAFCPFYVTLLICRLYYMCRNNVSVLKNVHNDIDIMVFITFIQCVQLSVSKQLSWMTFLSVWFMIVEWQHIIWTIYKSNYHLIILNAPFKTTICFFFTMRWRLEVFNKETPHFKDILLLSSKLHLLESITSGQKY